MSHPVVQAMSRGGCVLRIWHPASQFAQPDEAFANDVVDLTPGVPAYNAPIHSVRGLAPLLLRHPRSRRRFPAKAVVANIGQEISVPTALFWAWVEVDTDEMQGQRAWGTGRSVSAAVVDGFERARRIVARRTAKC